MAISNGKLRHHSTIIGRWLYIYLKNKTKRLEPMFKWLIALNPLMFSKKKQQQEVPE